MINLGGKKLRKHIAQLPEVEEMSEEKDGHWMDICIYENEWRMLEMVNECDHENI